MKQLNYVLLRAFQALDFAMAKKHKKLAAARAREGRAAARSSSSTQYPQSPHVIDLENFDFGSESDCSECGYDGGVEFDWSGSSDDDLEEKSGDEWSDMDDNLEDMDEKDLPPINLPPVLSDSGGDSEEKTSAATIPSIF